MIIRGRDVLQIPRSIARSFSRCSRFRFPACATGWSKTLKSLFELALSPSSGAEDLLQSSEEREFVLLRLRSIVTTLVASASVELFHPFVEEQLWIRG